MALDPVTNFAKGTVSTGYDASATSIILSSGDGAKFPSLFSFNVVWWNFTDYPDPADDPNVEIVRVSARSTDTLTVTRAQESTAATTKNTAGKIYKMILAVTKKVIDDIQPIRAIQLSLEPGGTPGTNIDITHFGAAITGFDPPSISNATNLAKSASSGSFALDGTGGIITMDIAEPIVGILSASIVLHDIGTDPTNELFVPYVDYFGGNMRISLRKRAFAAASDLTAVIDAGNRCDLLIAFMTSS